VHPALEFTSPPALRVETAAAVRHIDDALVACLAATPGADPREDGTAAIPLLLAALACGRWRAVRDMLRQLRGGALAALLPRYTAWTGDLGTAAALWATARDAAGGDGTNHRTDAAEAAAGSDADADLRAVIRAAALTGCERLATDLGDPATAARLRARAAAGDTAVDRPGSLQPDILHVAVALDLFGPDALWADAPSGAGRQPGTAAYGHAVTVLRVVHGVLGVQPDASRHRLWLRPRLPPGEGELAATELLTGADAVRVRVILEPGRMEVRVEQEAGPLPLTLLLEPYVPGAYHEGRVDGAPATLSARAVAGGTRVAVQLVLDHERVVEIGFGG
jgi:hypothetical protein